MTDEYRENFLKAEATFKHQYVYDPLKRLMVRLTEPDDEGNIQFYFVVYAIWNFKLVVNKNFKKLS